MYSGWTPPPPFWKCPKLVTPSWGGVRGVIMSINSNSAVCRMGVIRAPNITVVAYLAARERCQSWRENMSHTVKNCFVKDPVLKWSILYYSSLITIEVLIFNSQVCISKERNMDNIILCGAWNDCLSIFIRILIMFVIWNIYWSIDMPNNGSTLAGAVLEIFLILMISLCWWQALIWAHIQVNIQVHIRGHRQAHIKVVLWVMEQIQAHIKAF